MSFRSGFVAVVGRPNVGKSTLVNSLVGQKVAITSDKPQTTRNRIQGVLTRPDGQVVFIDTPGIHKPLHLLGEHLVRSARQAWQEVDLILFVVDAEGGPGPGDRRIAVELGSLSTPVILGINKIDAAPEPREAAIAAFDALQVRPLVQRLPLSGLTGENLAELVAEILRRLPEGPHYYPDDWVTDHPEQFVAAELIREQILHLTREEVPHAVAVRVDAMARRSGSELVDIQATILVERESQRGILIGKGGSMLREVGTRARREIETLLGSPVFLELWVKVSEDWRKRRSVLRELGYR